ncbi:MAG: prenyltransferase/squalene oxidase repeat-containing protein, partial [Planctomycetota bacterium]
MNTIMRTVLGLVLALGVVSPRASAGVGTLAAESRALARQTIDRAIAFLRSQQDDATGGWAHNPEGPNLPAISGLVLTGMLLDPRIDERDADVARGIDYVLGFRQPDGGI